MISRVSITIVLLFIALSSCGEKEPAGSDLKKEPVKMSVEGANTMQPQLFKGMYFFLDDKGSFTDCDSKTNYVLPGDNDNAGLKRVYSMITNDKKPPKKLYIEAEGFTSVQEKLKGKGLDSVLIVTRFVKLDTAINCEK